ncbi:MAG: hypothetical protein IT236_05860 [Bacteroidia bacterium]|nr:hypothetical protein [Bacteroidia bacterium]
MTILPSNPNKITSLIIWCLFALFGLILLCSCSHESKLHRAEKKIGRLIEKFPELIRKDTIYKVDTTFITGYETDTIIKAGVTPDTIVIRENHMTVKYYSDGKNVYIKGKVDTFFVTKKIPYIVNSVSVKPLNRKERFVMWVADNLAWIVLIGMGLFWVAKKLIKIYNPFARFLPKP